MSLCRIGTLAVGTLAVTSILWAASAQDKKPAPAGDGKQDKMGKEEKPEKKETVFFSTADAKFKELTPGASMAVVWGDPDKGAHRMFTKFAPGANFPLHSHTSEMHIVVIKGAYVYKPEKGDERRVGPGDYIDIPAGDRHVSGGDAKEGALFYEESSGKFDLVPVEKK
jgi:quercetin dioxygenase-like cupin family protein